MPHEFIRRAFLRARVAGVLLSAACIAAVVSVSACKGSTGTTSTSGTSGATGAGGANGSCVGGVEVNGTCEALCKPELCLPGNTCVGNQCRLTCTSHRDCATGSELCAAVKDDTGADTMACVASGKSVPYGAKCPLGKECDGAFACADATACGASVCGGQACTPDPSCTGKPGCGALCPDMTPCVVPTCPPEQCRPLTCLTAGQGDAYAFCSVHDCKANADCGAGLFCKTTRDPHGICGTMKGNSAQCGMTKEACIAPADFTKNGATYSEGPECLLTKTCIVRTQCDTCDTDLDCSLNPGTHCTTVGPAKVCTRDCTKDLDCQADYKCSSKACIPRFAGGCKGTGKYCEPCRSDDDCAGGGPTSVCIGASDGQRACFDVSFPHACMADTDCPKSAGGKNGKCITAADGANPGDINYQKCYLPYDANSNKYGCW